LLKLTHSSKQGLHVFKDKVRTIFKQQNEDMKSSKRLVYNKVGKFMAYEVPVHIFPAA